MVVYMIVYMIDWLCHMYMYMYIHQCYKCMHISFMQLFLTSQDLL